MALTPKPSRSLLPAAVAAALTLPAMVGAADSALSSEDQKFSYSIGLQVAQSMVRQGVTIDADAFALAVRDVMAGEKPRLSPAEMEAVMTKREEKAREDVQAMSSDNATAGAKFREEYAKQEGVKKLSSGVLYKVEREGSGAFPNPSDKVRVHYAGTLVDGREFDSSLRRGEPAEFPVRGVIQGWQEVLPLMREGAKWQIVVPPEMAYGSRGAGAVIGPNSTLVFDIELIKVL